MLIKIEQLQAHLQQDPPALVWISGDEPLLLQEACDIVRQYARDQGFTEREVLDASNSGFDWNNLIAAGKDLSLFADRKLLDVRLLGNKPDDKARTALEEYLASPNPDNMLLLTTGKIDKASQNTKWFKQLEARGLFCQIWPISEDQLPQWIGRRLQHMGIKADPDALQLLADRVEGNLLAAAQEIEKLRILCHDQHLDAQTVATVVADSSRFNAFALIDAALAGNTERVVRIVQHLQSEGAECLYILNMICREIRSLSAMLADIDQGHNIRGVLQSHRVWGNRTQMVTRAVQHHNQASLQRLLERARRVDQAVKGLLNLRPWDELMDLAVHLSDTRALPKGF